MGGVGTFNAIYQHPERFAGAIPSAGAFHAMRDENRIKDVPIWAFHGDKDSISNYVLSQRTFDRLHKFCGNMKLTKLSVPGHNYAPIVFTYTGDDKTKKGDTDYSSKRCDRTEDVWDWLFAQKRNKK
jgi:predicted peptidase